MAHDAAITVLDPSKLPGAPKTLPKGWDAADWDVPDGIDVVAALRAAVTVTSAPSVELVPIDPTYPTEIVLPLAIIALEPDLGIPLPAGDVGILAGQGGERKSTLTIQMAVAAAAAEDGALVSPFTGLAVDTNDPFIVGGDVGLAVRGGPVCMASWEDAAPWLAKRARACAEHLDTQSTSTRHTRVLRDAKRLASVQLSTPLFGVTAADEQRYTVPHTIAAGWERLWDTVRAVSAILVTIDPINLAAVWTGYGPTEVGAFLGAIKDELGDTAGALLVGHTGKAAAKADEPSALDILGSVAWKDRARCAFIAKSGNGHYELHLVKANYAPRHTFAYTASPTGALIQVDIRVKHIADHAALDDNMLEHIPAYPDSIGITNLVEIVKKGTGGNQSKKVRPALRRLVASGQVIVNAKGKRTTWSTPKAKED